MRRTMIAMGMALLCAAPAAADDETLQRIGPGPQVFPERIGQLAPDGTVTEWVEYGARGDCDWLLVFDCFEPDVGDNCPPPGGDGSDGEPIGGGTCGQGEPDDCDGFRWHFGPTYCNLYVTNDMKFDRRYANESAERIELAWYWYVNGPGSGENMAIIIKFYGAFPPVWCGDDCLGEYLGGVILDFGYGQGDPGGYYWADVDLCGLDWLQTPFDSAGAYNIWFATYDDGDPEDLEPATCAQPMLWGTGDAESPPDTDGRGEMSHQHSVEWDDDYPADWQHQVPVECYDHSYGVCPDPLGAMFCLYINAHDAGCAGDLDGDWDTDRSDLGILLGDWGCTSNCVGDLDDDGDTGQADLGILLADWGCGC